MSSIKAFATFKSRPLSDDQQNRLRDLRELVEQVWDHMDAIPVVPGNTEAGRLVSLAKTNLEQAMMWGTKAISRS